MDVLQKKNILKKTPVSPPDPRSKDNSPNHEKAEAYANSGNYKILRGGELGFGNFFGRRLFAPSRVNTLRGVGEGV